MKLHLSYWVLYGFVILALVGCGGVGPSEEQTSRLVLTPLPISVIEGDCEDASLLENWIQTLVFNQVEFDNFLESATGKSRSELYRLVQGLNTVAFTVANTPILSCGEEAYTLTIAAMQQTLTSMQAYINAERQDLDVIIVSAKRSFETAQTAQNELITQLDAMYQQGNTTPIP